MESYLRLKKQWEVWQKMGNCILSLKVLNSCNHRKQREKVPPPNPLDFQSKFVLNFSSERVGQLGFFSQGV